MFDHIKNARQRMVDSYRARTFSPINLANIPLHVSQHLDQLNAYVSNFQFQKPAIESVYQRQLADSLSVIPEYTNRVTTELVFAGGRVDIDVLNEVAIELKCPRNVDELQRFYGQVLVYLTRYGPNIITILFSDNLPGQRIIEYLDAFKKIMETTEHMKAYVEILTKRTWVR